MKNTKTRIADIEFPSYVMNASGPKDVTLEELRVIGESASGAIVTKSCTLEPREGNPEPRYADLPQGSIQSMGLPNLGYEAYIEMIPELRRHGKPVMVSVSGLCQADNEKIIAALQGTDVDLIELNLSCPNIVGKPQIGYDFGQTRTLLDSMSKINKKPLGLKLPPYFDPVHQDEMAAIIRGHDIAFLTCINSVGNTLVIDPETEHPLIKPKGGFGGLGGDFIKPVALANVRAFYERLNGRVPIIGVGGVKSGMDAFEFLLAGASAVQLGTVFMKEGAECFARIEKELSQILESKGYTSINEAIGRLKPL